MSKKRGERAAEMLPVLTELSELCQFLVEQDARDHIIVCQENLFNNYLYWTIGGWSHGRSDALRMAKEEADAAVSYIREPAPAYRSPMVMQASY
jgi:hypothetical protein